MELTTIELGYPCGTCRSRGRFPKYKCKGCKFAYSSNYVKDKRFDVGYVAKQTRREQKWKSDKRLKHIYAKIKEMYFNGNYIPRAEEVIFSWKIGKYSKGGWCRKQTKEIKIGGIYKNAFTTEDWSEIQDEKAKNLFSWICRGKTIKKRLVELMVHEAVHLRLPHHRKSFRNRVEEIKSRITEEDVKKIFEGIPE
jgi:hypothetical protein